MTESGTRTVPRVAADAALVRMAAAVTAALVIAQALLAGRGWFIDYDLIKVHGYVGNATFIAVIALALVAFNGMRASVTDRIDVGIALLLALLIFAQVGLGYGGRDSSTAASLHIPNGVLIMGLLGALLARTFPRRV